MGGRDLAAEPWRPARKRRRNPHAHSQMLANRLHKLCSTSLIRNGTLIRTAVSYHFSLIGLAKIKQFRILVRKGNRAKDTLLGSLLWRAIWHNLSQPEWAGWCVRHDFICVNMAHMRVRMQRRSSEADTPPVGHRCLWRDGPGPREEGRKKGLEAPTGRILISTSYPNPALLFYPWAGFALIMHKI